MYKILIFAIFSTILFTNCHKKIANSSSSTEVKEVIVRPLNRPVAKDSFPYTWFGTWAGTLDIYNAKGISQSIPMEMVIGPTGEVGVFQWNLIYGADREKGLRPYLLRTIDASKGLYLNDEMNSIKMEAYYMGGKLFCTFGVEGNLLTTIEEKDGDKIKFEIIFGKEKPVSVTGNQVVKGDTIPSVKTMPIMINQRAILTKKK
jgi:hypothetical protein